MQKMSLKTASTHSVITADDLLIAINIKLKQ